LPGKDTSDKYDMPGVFHYRLPKPKMDVVLAEHVMRATGCGMQMLLGVGFREGGVAVKLALDDTMDDQAMYWQGVHDRLMNDGNDAYVRQFKTMIYCRQNNVSCPGHLYSGVAGRKHSREASSVEDIDGGYRAYVWCGDIVLSRLLAAHFGMSLSDVVVRLVENYAVLRLWLLCKGYVNEAMFLMDRARGIESWDDDADQKMVALLAERMVQQQMEARMDRTVHSGTNWWRHPKYHDDMMGTEDEVIHRFREKVHARCAEPIIQAMFGPTGELT
jgi:hypothetical protein